MPATFHGTYTIVSLDKAISRIVQEIMRSDSSHVGSYSQALGSQMNEAKVADLAGLDERRILRHSKALYAARVGGFFVGVLVPFGIMVWAIATVRIRERILAMLCRVPFGYVGFAVSLHAASYCKLCGRELERFWSSEQRGIRRSSGPIVICRHCNAFETRLSSDHEG